nr:hypothetical protein [Tanacetum cinerariifolium]
MSSPTHPTPSDVGEEYAFPSANILNYTLTLPNYSSASSGNTPSESSNNSYGLEFFVPEELLPPKKQTHLPSLSSTDLSNPSQKQACILIPPSFLTYTHTPP